MVRILIEKNSEQKVVEDSEYWDTYQKQGWVIATKSTSLSITPWTDELRDLVEEIESVGSKVNPDGTMTLYHATTREKAKQILSERILRRPSDAPDYYGVYLSTSPTVAEDYGDGSLIQVRIKLEDLHPDDIFPGRRMDFRVETQRGIYKPESLLLYQLGKKIISLQPTLTGEAALLAQRIKKPETKDRRPAKKKYVEPEPYQVQLGDSRYQTTLGVVGVLSLMYMLKKKREAQWIER